MLYPDLPILMMVLDAHRVLMHLWSAVSIFPFNTSFMASRVSWSFSLASDPSSSTCHLGDPLFAVISLIENER